MAATSATRLWRSLLCIVLILSTGVLADNYSTPVSFFYTRPDFEAPAMNVTFFNAELVAPGYLFMTPYQSPQSGFYIYDKRGNLVFDGFGETGPFNAHNAHVCEYNNSDHICMFQGTQRLGYARGHGIVMDSNYRIVKTIESVGDITSADQHEFVLLDNGASALISIYQQVPYDLSRINVTNGMGWVMDSVFQEINVTDNSLIFEWRSLDHVEPYGTYVYPRSSDISGNGLSSQSPWDYFHINSIRKSERTGNYIISARHMSTIYMINGTDGSIVWRLQAGGDSDFICNGFNFSFQHDAQIRAENETTMIISIYDNASNNYNQTSKASSAKFIALDFPSMTASLIAPPAYYPLFELMSASQGNTQLLPNGNIFTGRGSWALMSEHTQDGVAVWAGQLSPFQGVQMVYRAFSYDWHSTPKHTKPALFTFSKFPDALTAFYVSWNGATEVASWNFYGANDVDDTFMLIGTTAKMGFETLYKSETHYTWSFAEALDFDGRSLRNSSFQQTFVPSPALAPSCAEDFCPKAVERREEQEEEIIVEARPVIQPISRLRHAFHILGLLVLSLFVLILFILALRIARRLGFGPGGPHLQKIIQSSRGGVQYVLEASEKAAKRVPGPSTWNVNPPSHWGVPAQFEWAMPRPLRWNRRPAGT